MDLTKLSIKYGYKLSQNHGLFNILNYSNMSTVSMVRETCKFSIQFEYILTTSQHGLIQIKVRYVLWTTYYVSIMSNDIILPFTWCGVVCRKPHLSVNFSYFLLWTCMSEIKFRPYFSLMRNTNFLKLTQF